MCSLAVDKDEMILGTPDASENQNYWEGLKKSALIVQCDSFSKFIWTMLTIAYIGIFKKQLLIVPEGGGQRLLE